MSYASTATDNLPTRMEASAMFATRQVQVDEQEQALHPGVTGEFW